MSEEARLLERLMGSEARVYQFRGVFLECWLEYETKDGVLQRSEPARIEATPFLPNLKQEDFKGVEIPRDLQGWIVVRGSLHERLDLHLRAEVNQVQGDRTRTLGLTTPVRGLELPKRQGDTLRGGYFNLGSIPPYIVDLPNEPGKEFTIFSDSWKESTSQPGGGENLIREITVSLKAKLLPAAGKEEPASETTFQGQPVSHWTAQLKDRDPAARSRAQEALSVKKAAPVLIQALKDSDVEVRSASAFSLAKIGPDATTAIPALIDLLRTAYNRDHDATTVALGKMGPDAVPDLVRALKEAIDNPVRQEVERARHADPNRFAMDPSWRQAMGEESQAFRSSVTLGRGTAGALAMIGPSAKEAVPALIEAMSSGAFGRHAGLALANVGPAAVPALFEALKSPAGDTSRSAGDAFLALSWQDKTVVPKLLEALKSDDESLRVGAVKVLVGIPGDRRAEGLNWVSRDNRDLIALDVVPAMAAALKDKNTTVREYAVRTLAALGPKAKPALPAIIEALRDESSEVQEAALDAFMTIGPDGKTGLPELESVLKHPDVLVRVKAAQSLLTKADPAHDAALKTLIEALSYKAGSGTKQVVSAEAKSRPFTKNLAPKSEEDQVRSAAARALGNLGAKAKVAVPALIEALKTPEHRDTATAAAAALKRIDPEAAKKARRP